MQSNRQIILTEEGSHLSGICKPNASNTKWIGEVLSLMRYIHAQVRNVAELAEILGPKFETAHKCVCGYLEIDF